MNKLLVTLFVTFIMLISSTHTYAENSVTYFINLIQCSEPDYIDDVPVRHRTAPRPIICAITPSGVNIPSVNTQDIIAYDVCSPAGDCIASFTSEQDFISFIYSINGIFEIRIHLESHLLRGYIQF